MAVRESKLAALVPATAPVRRRRGNTGPGWRPFNSPGHGAEMRHRGGEGYDLLHQTRCARRSRKHLARSSPSCRTVPCRCCRSRRCRTIDDRYLIEDFTLHYVPAGAVLDFTAARRRADAAVERHAGRRRPDVSPEVDAGPAAAGAAGVARRACSISVGLSPRDCVTVLEGDAASEGRSARDGPAGKSVLHFATHAIVNDAEPLQLISRARRDWQTLVGMERSRRRRFYGLNLQADVVVLSACRFRPAAASPATAWRPLRALLCTPCPPLLLLVCGTSPTNQARS